MSTAAIANGGRDPPDRPKAGPGEVVPSGFVGKNNKARRAAKSKLKAKARSQGRPGGSYTGSGGATGSNSGSRWRPSDDGESLFTRAEVAHHLLLRCAAAHHTGAPGVSDTLEKLYSMPAAIVDRQAEAALLDQVDALWSGGWQPRELQRQGKRGCSTATATQLVSLAIAVDHVGRRSVSLDQRWVAQVEGLGLPKVNGKPGWIPCWAQDGELDRRQAVRSIVDALANLLHLPRLERVLPPPGTSGSAAGSGEKSMERVAGGEIDPLLDRIRNLLAKAESTTFEAEAIAFTGKAQELMTRHAIDVATLQGSRRQHEERPVAIRLPIDAPYADAKSLLLQTIADAGRCRSVFHIGLELSTVVGFPADVAAVELLFTSLLLQAQRAMADSARGAPAGTRTRSQSYRSAFLLAYTHRIGDRLREINDAVYSEVEAEHGSAFLPVLRSRSAEVDDFMDARFAGTVSSPVRGGYDAAGWAGGRLAADTAQLNFGDLGD